MLLDIFYKKFTHQIIQLKLLDKYQLYTIRQIFKSLATKENLIKVNVYSVSLSALCKVNVYSVCLSAPLTLPSFFFL